MSVCTAACDQDNLELILQGMHKAFFFSNQICLQHKAAVRKIWNDQKMIKKQNKEKKSKTKQKNYQNVSN